MISREDFRWFVDVSLDQMVTILNELGDEAANRGLEIPGTNSAYAIVFHCLGVMGWWGRGVVGGQEVPRDRDAEFRATGLVSDLVAKIQTGREQFHNDIDDADMAAPPLRPVQSEDGRLPRGTTQGGALFHVYEELAQHLGQLELTRDVLLAPRHS